ncbi:ergothioneine biosynthesis protein EgtB [Spirulina sp. CS-785/01]|uniref:ergothioneine biosynthesis protein EgtB n=1 Tax=Spirulina sp. CS-785/01 TaxID=3021716 RepID=UPI00232C1231|nr:ergothioneine biosynthesis protein EgtB [Spirulina sp. CS-785/01]MDB9312759.1 ergothioneine biosynthesis protein EgtB [Spirulina sp. CS-785/01]
MKSISSESKRVEIAQNLTECRDRTLDLFQTVTPEEFTQQAHPDFSPIGWHLGHIAFVEAQWILERYAGYSPFYPQYRQLFAADGLPKQQRQNLPPYEVIQGILSEIRTHVLDYLETAPLAQQERLWRWLIQHECQHSETITFVLQLLRWPHIAHFPPSVTTPPTCHLTEMVAIPAGEFQMGYDATEAQDNEQVSHNNYVESYQIDRYPVTCKQYRDFMEAGGYQKREFWSEQGWHWLQDNPISQPLYWSDSPEWDEHPVCGVNWYEAEAYANFRGKRLPTEAEWEKAARWHPTTGETLHYPWGHSLPTTQRCNHNTLVGHTTPVNSYPSGQSPSGCWDMLGNVWEWTNSWFGGYSGFKYFPYRGYSQVYFDGQHRVLRGGSWSTRPWTLRGSFRNWYHPWVRQIFVGFRCAV